MYSGLLRLGGLACAASLSYASSVPHNVRASGMNLNVPTSLPSDASDKVDPDFLGLAFEETSWVRYALDDAGNLNQFSINLMESIYSRTGGKPIIRLGGTSTDYALYLPGQEQPGLPVAEQDNYQNVGGTTIGPKYWQIARDFTEAFPDARYMVQIPMPNTNLSEPVAWAKSSADILGLDKIHSYQIGNEPNAYDANFHGEGGQILGPPKWLGHQTNESWVNNYKEIANLMYDNVEGLPKSFFTAFDVGAIVSNPQVALWLYDVKTCFDLGLNDDNILKEVSHHYYQNQAGGAADLRAGLMIPAATHQRLDYFRKHIEYLKENHPDIPFIINEIGNSLQPTQSYPYQAVLGSTLWEVDFYLYSLSIGVARFNWQQIMHSGFDMWLPVASAGYAPQVFANYYGHPYLADFVGTSGKTQVAKVEIEEARFVPNLQAYAAFEDDQAKRIAFVNLDYWNRTSSGYERTHVDVSLNVPNEDSKYVTVTYLTSPDGAGAGAETMSYADSIWTYDDMGKEQKGVTKNTKKYCVRNGKTKVRIPSSAAAIVYLE